MKVNPALEPKLTPTPSSGPRATDSSARASAGTGLSALSQGTSVRLSPITQAMTNGVARSGTDSFDAAKVEAIRTAIQNGSFSINAETIADKMLSQARELLGVASGGSRP